MRAAVLLLLASAAGAAPPPVTQEEAVAFHAAGLCAMAEPGKGLTRADGQGWITSSLPGLHRLYVQDGSVSRIFVDITPGQPQRIVVTPGAVLQWCPAYRPPGRERCGPVPPAFLYDAVTVR